MAIASALLAVGSWGRLLTAADLAVMPTHLPSGDVDFELDKGRLILMVPPGQLHGRIQSRLAKALGIHGEDAGHGAVFTEAGVVLSRNPDTVVAPDVAFIASNKLPVRESPEDYLETIPDLVVEVRSRNDTNAEIGEKVAVYLAAGVRVVWVADPVAKTVVVHYPNSESRVYKGSDTLILDGIIPGLQLKLADIFPI